MGIVLVGYWIICFLGRQPVGITAEAVAEDGESITREAGAIQGGSEA